MAGARSQQPRHTIGSSVNRLSGVVSPSPMPRRLHEVFAHTVVAHDPATHAIADHDHMAADRLAKNQVVESRDTVQVRGRHAKKCGDIVKALVGNPAAMPLHDFQGIDADGLHVSDSAAASVSISLISSGLSIASPPHRSMSASTKSIAPKIAIRSGTINPRQISGSICM